jgi:ligand-binding SRPBCC domain-containing protein
MSAYRIDEHVWVPRPLDEVFAFFSKPENLGELTPPELSFDILTPSPVPMAEGALIDYRISLGPLPMNWRTLIEIYEPPHRFVDVQLRGPYALWRHEHTFEAVDGGTAIRDRIDYAMPFGPLGTLAHALAVKGRLRRIFAYRRDTVSRLFSEDPHERQ